MKLLLDHLSKGHEPAEYHLRSIKVKSEVNKEVKEERRHPGRRIFSVDLVFFCRVAAAELGLSTEEALALGNETLNALPDSIRGTN